MKHLFKLFIVTISFTLILSCEKEKTQISNNQPDISIKNNRMVFKNVDIYSNAIEDFNKQPELTLKKLNALELKRKKDEISTEDTLYDEFLLSILNENKIVQIDDYIIKIDLPQNKVDVLPVKDSLQIADLEKGNPNAKILSFSPEEEVFESLEDTTKILKSTRGLFCKDRRAKSTAQTHSWEYGGDGGYRILVRANYLKAGIYFALHAKVEYDYKWLGIWWPRKLNGTIECKGSCIPRCEGTFPIAKSKTELNDRIGIYGYSRFKALKNYKFTVTGRSNVDNAIISASIAD